MLLLDTSVWVDHLRKRDDAVQRALLAGEVLAHPFVNGEIALGQLRQRTEVLSLLCSLPQAERSTDDEVMHFIENYKLAGRGIGYVDAHLLASTRLTGGTRLWTRDKKLRQTALQLGLGAEAP